MANVGSVIGPAGCPVVWVERLPGEAWRLRGLAKPRSDSSRVHIAGVEEVDTATLLVADRRLADRRIEAVVDRTTRAATGALETVNQPEAIRCDPDEDYLFRGEQAAGKEWNAQSLRGHIGFAAQDVKQVVPELADYDEEQDLYSVNYDGFVPLLVAAVQEQQRQFEQLKSEIEALKSALRRQTGE